MARPSDKPTGAVWRLLEEWMNTKPVGFTPNQSQVAEMLDVSTSLLSNWKFRESAIQLADLERISEVTKIDFMVLVQAARDDLPAVVQLRPRSNPVLEQGQPVEEAADHE